MNISNAIDPVKLSIKSIPPLSSRWKTLAIVTSLAAICFLSMSAKSPNNPIWYNELPFIAKSVYIMSVGLLAYFITLQIGHFVMNRIARGTRVADLCRPAFMWAFFAVSLFSILDLVLLTMIDMHANGIDVVLAIILAVFAAVMLFSALGLYGWLTVKPFLSRDTWRKLAAFFVASSVMALAIMPRWGASSETFAVDFALMLSAIIWFFLAAIAHVLYANSAAFHPPADVSRVLFSSVETDLPPPNLNHAPAHQNRLGGSYL